LSKYYFVFINNQTNGFCCSSNLKKLVASKKQAIYCGFDPTAKSLHIGNLVGK
jgi:tyrosyl-tRNA synthetase